MTQSLTKRAKLDKDFNDSMSANKILNNSVSDSSIKLNLENDPQDKVFSRMQKPENATNLDQNRLPPDRWHGWHGWHPSHHELEDLKPSI